MSTHVRSSIYPWFLINLKWWSSSYGLLQVFPTLTVQMIWASTQENLSSRFANNTGAEQHVHPRRLTSALSLTGRYPIKTYFKQNFNSLASLCSSGDWFESRFFGNPNDRFCRDEAHIFSKVGKSLCLLVDEISCI